MGSNTSRTIAGVLIFLGIFILPWWLSVLLILISFFMFELFYEGLFFGLVIDLLYFIPRESFHSLPIVFIFLLLFFLLLRLLNKQLRINDVF